MTNEERRERRKNDHEYRARCHELERERRRKRRTDPSFIERNKAWQRAYRERNPDKISAKSSKDCERLKYKYRTDPAFRKSRLDYSNQFGKSIKNKYGITSEEYHSILESQGGVCAICNNPETTVAKRWKNSLPKRLSVDHCHSSKKVRGLLCVHCNRGLGGFRDNVDFLRAAIAYLS